MQRFAPKIACYLEIFRGGDTDNAFHGLLKLHREILPELMTAFREEHDPDVRAFLVEVIWPDRDHSVVPFLAEALSDLEPSVWRQALDGLVALASPDEFDVLHQARTRKFFRRVKLRNFTGGWRMRWSRPSKRHDRCKLYPGRGNFLTIGFRKIFDPLAALAGLVLSA